MGRHQLFLTYFTNTCFMFYFEAELGFYSYLKSSAHFLLSK